MPNTIVGLKYKLQVKKINTEGQLLNEFSSLRENYEKFKNSFKITADNKKIADFKSFLEVAVRDNNIAREGEPKVILEGSGDIGGITVKEASVEYDLSEISELVRYWNQYRDGSCHSCHNHRYVFDGMDSENSCSKFGRDGMKWKDCKEYDPVLKNANGTAARPLAELIAEASKN
jgi:hypothetical protein